MKYNKLKKENKALTEMLASWVTELVFEKTKVTEYKELLDTILKISNIDLIRRILLNHQEKQDLDTMVHNHILFSNPDRFND